MLKKLAVLVCFAVLVAVIPAAADQWDKKTTVTFNVPVELPGVVLIPGTYVFKLLDSPSDRHIVRVFNADETSIITTILAIPNRRLTPTSDTVIRFEERRIGTPEAIRAWFYPGDDFGQEFVYPKARGMELAESAQVPVLTAGLTPAEKPEELIKESVLTIAPSPKEAGVAWAPPEPAEPEPATVVAEAKPAAELTFPPVEELPETGSNVPLVMLVGVCALGIGGALLSASSHRS